MRRLEINLSIAAHEGGVCCRIETQTIGQPCGGIAEVAINADQAGRRGCGIAAQLAGNVVMGWTDQSCGQFWHTVWYGGVERGERLFSHLRGGCSWIGGEIGISLEPWTKNTDPCVMFAVSNT